MIRNTSCPRKRHGAPALRNRASERVPIIDLACIQYMHNNACMQLIEVPIEHAFQALSDPTRLRVVRLLVSTNEEICLCEIVDSLLEPQYKLSRHLKTLRQAGLLVSEKEGRWVYHRLVSSAEHLTELFRLIGMLPDPNGVYSGDLARFEQRLTHREGGRCRVGVLTDVLKSEAS